MSSKMKRLFAIVAVALCLGMLLSVFSACGDARKPSSEEETETAETEKETGKKSGEEETDEKGNDTKKPATEETETEEEDPLIGSWTVKRSLNENFEAALSSLFTFDDDDVKKEFSEAVLETFEDYAIEFKITFRSNGKAETRYNADSLKKKLDEDLADDLYEVFEIAIEDDYEDVDAMLASGDYADMDDFIKKQGFDSESVLKDFKQEGDKGYYKVEDGKLYLADTKDELDDATGAAYSIRKNKLTLEIDGEEAVFEKD